MALDDTGWSNRRADVLPNSRRQPGAPSPIPHCASGSLSFAKGR